MYASQQLHYREASSYREGASRNPFRRQAG